jgi:hypothetical protein
MCIVRKYKASTKAVNKLHFAKHELLATTGKATAHVQQPLQERRHVNNDAVPLVKSTAIPTHESSPNTETTTLSSNESIANSSSPSPLEDTNAFDFDFSFLQIPTGGIIVIPRREERSLKDRTSGTSVSSEMKPVDRFNLRSLHKVLGKLREEEPAMATASPAPVTTSIGDFQGSVSSDDFVFTTPRIQREAMSALTPPTTPRLSARDCIFVDAARLSESLSIPLL